MKPKTEKSLRTANALGLVGNILFALILALYVTLNFLMMVCDGGAVYINAELENDLLFYGLYLGCLNLFPILCVGLMFVIYNAFCKSHKTAHLVSSSVLGFASALAYIITYIPLSSFYNTYYARDYTDALYPSADRAYGLSFSASYRIFVIFVLLFMLFMCFVQIAFVSYYKSVEKGANRTQIMLGYERFRIVPAVVWLVGTISFVYGIIV